MNTFRQGNESDLEDLRDEINAAYTQGTPVAVNGRFVKAWTGQPAKVWTTGSLSVFVEAKNNKINVIWFKPGQPLPSVTR